MKYTTIAFLFLIVLINSVSRLHKSKSSFSANQILNFLFSCQYNVSPTTKSCAAGMLFSISDQTILNGPVLSVQDQTYNYNRWVYGPAYNFVLSISDNELLKQISSVFQSWNLTQFTNMPLNVNGTIFNYVGSSLGSSNVKASFSDGKRALTICRYTLSTTYLLVALGRNGVSWKYVEDCCATTVGTYPLN